MLLRSFLFTCLFLSLSLSALAQEIWLDENLTKVSKRKATYQGRMEQVDSGGFILYVFRKDETPYIKGYYRTGKKPLPVNKAGYWNYYYPDGSLRIEGSYQGEKLVGPWTWYYANGKVNTHANYNDSGKLHGDYTSYYQSGQTYKANSYLDGRLNGEMRTYYPDGTLYLISQRKEGKMNDSTYTFFPDGTLAEKSFFADGHREGLNLFYHENGKLAAWEFYQEGQLDSFYFLNSKGDDVTSLVDTSKLAFYANEWTQLPEIVEFYKNIVNTLSYPTAAIENNIQGKVYVFFILTPEGEIVDLQTTNCEIGYGIEKAALNSVKQLLKNMQALPEHNRKFYYMFTIPIKFVVE